MRTRSVLFSGAGIAGPALAHALLRLGFEPTLVERARELRTSGYVIDMWGQGMQLLGRMGLLPRVMEAGYHVREIRIVDARGRRVGGFDTDAMWRASGDQFVSLRRGDLAAILYDSIASRCETLWDDSISGLQDHGDAVEVQFDRAHARRFDMVIGADGLHSRVRELVFGPQSSYERFLGYTAAAFDVEGYRPRDEGVYMAYATPGHQVARFAMRDDRTMFLLVTADDRASSLSAHAALAQKAYEREHFERLGWECPQIVQALQGCPSFYCDRVSQICMPRWHRGRICLLGDAAFAPSLLAGQGAALAIIASQVLAAELGATQSVEQAFAHYEARLRPFLARKQRAARSFASSFAPRTRLGLTLRNLASVTLNLPGLAAWSIGSILRDEIVVPELPEPLHDAARAAAQEPPLART